MFPNFTGWSWNRAIALETEFIELFSKKRDDFGVTNIVTARGICWIWSFISRTYIKPLSDTAKFINRLRNANLYKTYQHLCKYVTQRIGWLGRQPTPNSSLSDILVQSSIDRWLPFETHTYAGSRPRYAARNWPFAAIFRSFLNVFCTHWGHLRTRYSLSVRCIEHFHKVWLVYAECDLNVTRAPFVGRS